VNWTATDLKTLRYRLGWSQAEMARSLKVDLTLVTEWEAGRAVPQKECLSQLIGIMHQAESNAERVQCRPLAEAMMRDLGLCQIHNMAVLESAIGESLIESRALTSPYVYPTGNV
jgi:transcriptional regulator with XRE-family HTH domain